MKLISLIEFLFLKFSDNMYIKRLQLFFHYLGLYARSLAGCKQFRVKLSHICTTDNIIATGQEYQYREGRYVERIIIESIRIRGFYITMEVFLVDENRRFTCESRFVDFGYMGRFLKNEKMVKVWCFAMTLSYSRYSYWQLVTD